MNSATDSVERTDWVVVWAATFAGTAIAMQLGKSAAALPLIRAEFGVSLGALAGYVALVSIVAATVGVLFGTATRTLGARRAGLIGLWLVALGAAAGAEATGFNMLMTSRAVEAFGFALTVTAMPAVFQPAVRQRDRALALGIWAIWLPAGIAVMMALSWLVIDAVGWRGLFRLAALAPALAAFLLWGATRTQAAARALVSAAPVSRLFRHEILVTVAMFISFACTNYIVMSFLPTILFDEFAIPPAQGAVVSLGSMVLLMAMNILTGWLMRFGLGFRTLYAASFAVMAVSGMILFSGSFGALASITAALVFATAGGIPPALVWLSLPLMTQQPGEVPVLSGLLFQGAGIGQVLGPLLTAWVVGLGGWHLAMWEVAAFSVVSLFLTALLPRSLAFAKH